MLNEMSSSENAHCLGWEYLVSFEVLKPKPRLVRNVIRNICIIELILRWGRFNQHRHFFVYAIIFISEVLMIRRPYGKPEHTYIQKLRLLAESFSK